MNANYGNDDDDDGNDDIMMAMVKITIRRSTLGVSGEFGPMFAKRRDVPNDSFFSLISLRGTLFLLVVTTPASSRTSVAVLRIWFQSRVKSWTVVLWLVMVNLMTYCPLIMHGTACIFPLELSFFNSFSVIRFSPFILKTTIPMCRAAGISPC